MRAGRRVHGYHRQAGTIVGYALVNLQFVGEGRGHREVAVGAFGLHIGNGAERFYNSSKHVGLR
jgi:hypothetical protein